MIIDTNGDGADKKLWQEDWDDEEVDEDFAKQLRAQIRKWNGAHRRLSTLLSGVNKVMQLNLSVI